MPINTPDFKIWSGKPIPVKTPSYLFGFKSQKGNIIKETEKMKLLHLFSILFLIMVLNGIIFLLY